MGLRGRFPQSHARKKQDQLSFGERMRAQPKHQLTSQRFFHDVLPTIIFLVPGFGLFFLFMLGPMGYSLRMSFYNWNLANPEMSTWVGFNNYIRALNDPVFRHAVLNTLIYTIITVSVQMVLGLWVAVLLNQPIHGRAFFRVSYYFPVITSWVIVSVLFEYLFNGQAGLVNYVLRDVLHITTTNLRWFIDDKLFFVPMTLLAIWKGVGWTTIIYLAGLQNIPAELYEAATVDGANGWQRFRFITLPLLRSTLVYLLIVLIIGGLNAYVSFFLITNGGNPLDRTHSVLTWMTKVTFLKQDFGYGAAISYWLTLFVFLISLLQLKLLQKPADY